MNQSNDMMNQSDGWMHGWGSQGILLLTGIGVLVVLLLIVLIRRRTRT